MRLSGGGTTGWGVMCRSNMTYPHCCTMRSSRRRRKRAPTARRGRGGDYQ